MRPLLSSLALRVKILFRHRYLDSSQTSHSLTDHAPPLRRSAHLFYVRRHSQEPSHYKSLTCKEGPERYPKPGILNLLPLYIHSIVEFRETSWDSRWRREIVGRLVWDFEGIEAQRTLPGGAIVPFMLGSTGAFLRLSFLHLVLERASLSLVFRLSHPIRLALMLSSFMSFLNRLARFSISSSSGRFRYQNLKSR